MDTQWQTVIMIFNVGLVLFQVPGCIGYRVFPPSKVSALLYKMNDKLIAESGSHLAFAGGAPPVSCNVRYSTSQEHSSVVYSWVPLKAYSEPA
jgi:hypothetical protein